MVKKKAAAAKAASNDDDSSEEEEFVEIVRKPKKKKKSIDSSNTAETDGDTKNSKKKKKKKKKTGASEDSVASKKSKDKKLDSFASHTTATTVDPSPPASKSSVGNNANQEINESWAPPMQPNKPMRAPSPPPMGDTEKPPPPRPGSRQNLGRRGPGGRGAPPRSQSGPAPTGGRGGMAAGRSMRAMPQGRGGRGRGVPSQRGIGQSASEQIPRNPPPMRGGRGRGRGRGPASGRALPPSAKSLRRVPGAWESSNGSTHNPRQPPAAKKPASARGMKAPGRGFPSMGKNATSNRKLPPPPGTRSKSSFGLFGKGSSEVSAMTNSDDDDLSSEILKDGSNKPASILRQSARGRGAPRRISHDGNITLSQHSTSFSIDEDEEFDMSSDEFANETSHEGAKASDIPMVNRMPSTHGRGLAGPGPGFGEKGKSMRGWTESFRWSNVNGDRKTLMSEFSASKSVRSLLTVDMEFEDEPLWKQWLRYIRILPPHQDEKPIKRNIRILTWISLFFDFLTGVVSLATYDGVTECCERPILSAAGGNVNWNNAIQITVYVYFVLIFAEIIPVMREGFPFNLLNPFVGFLITFAMFFDDRILEAVVMWAIEASAVICELLVYRLKVRWHNQRGARLKKCEDDLKALRKEKRRIKLISKGEYDEDDDSSSGASFADEEDGAGTIATSGSKRPKDVSQIRETRLLRERRLLRQAQSDDTRTLRYHLGGVTFNCGMAGISLLMIVMVGRSGGLCLVDMTPPNIFKTGQLDKCFDCKGTSGPCEVCRDDGTSHCYYPYY